MKEITFKPLRRIKRTGKITVLSYMQWRNVKTADYNKFILVIDSEYKNFPKDELVYNHKGENLFWRDYNPEHIPMITGYELKDGEPMLYPRQWKTDYMYSAKGIDVDGVPAFSHYTADEIIDSKADMTDFEPLTVEIVRWWLGWFLYKLDNCKLTYNQDKK